MAKKQQSSERKLKETLDRIKEDNAKSQTPEYEAPERKEKK